MRCITYLFWQLLLRHGASVVKTNTHKEAPLDLAASNQEMLLLLQSMLTTWYYLIDMLVLLERMLTFVALLSDILLQKYVKLGLFYLLGMLQLLQHADNSVWFYLQRCYSCCIKGAPGKV